MLSSSSVTKAQQTAEQPYKNFIDATHLDIPFDDSPDVIQRTENGTIIIEHITGSIENDVDSRIQGERMLSKKRINAYVTSTPLPRPPTAEELAQELLLAQSVAAQSQKELKAEELRLVAAYKRYSEIKNLKRFKAKLYFRLRNLAFMGAQGLVLKGALIIVGPAIFSWFISSGWFLTAAGTVSPTKLNLLIAAIETVIPINPGASHALAESLTKMAELLAGKSQADISALFDKAFGGKNPFTENVGHADLLKARTSGADVNVEIANYQEAVFNFIQVLVGMNLPFKGNVSANVFLEMWDKKAPTGAPDPAQESGPAINFIGHILRLSFPNIYKFLSNSESLQKYMPKNQALETLRDTLNSDPIKNMPGVSEMLAIVNLGLMLNNPINLAYNSANLMLDFYRDCEMDINNIYALFTDEKYASNSFVHEQVGSSIDRFFNNSGLRAIIQSGAGSAFLTGTNYVRGALGLESIQQLFSHDNEATLFYGAVKVDTIIGFVSNLGYRSLTGAITSPVKDMLLTSVWPKPTPDDDDEQEKAAQQREVQRMFQAELDAYTVGLAAKGLRGDALVGAYTEYRMLNAPPELIDAEELSAIESVYRSAKQFIRKTTHSIPSKAVMLSGVAGGLFTLTAELLKTPGTPGSKIDLFNLFIQPHVSIVGKLTYTIFRSKINAFVRELHMNAAKLYEEVYQKTVRDFLMSYMRPAFVWKEETKKSLEDWFERRIRLGIFVRVALGPLMDIVLQTLANIPTEAADTAIQNWFQENVGTGLSTAAAMYSPFSTNPIWENLYKYFENTETLGDLAAAQTFLTGKTNNPITDGFNLANALQAINRDVVALAGPAENAGEALATTRAAARKAGDDPISDILIDMGLLPAAPAAEHTGDESAKEFIANEVKGNLYELAMDALYQFLPHNERKVTNALLIRVNGSSAIKIRNKDFIRGYYRQQFILLAAATGINAEQIAALHRSGRFGAYFPLDESVMKDINILNVQFKAAPDKNAFISGVMDAYMKRNTGLIGRLIQEVTNQKVYKLNGKFYRIAPWTFAKSRGDFPLLKRFGFALEEFKEREDGFTAIADESDILKAIFGDDYKEISKLTGRDGELIYPQITMKDGKPVVTLKNAGGANQLALAQMFINAYRVRISMNDDDGDDTQNDPIQEFIMGTQEFREAIISGHVAHTNFEAAQERFQAALSSDAARAEYNAFKNSLKGGPKVNLLSADIWYAHRALQRAAAEKENAQKHLDRILERDGALKTRLSARSAARRKQMEEEIAEMEADPFFDEAIQLQAAAAADPNDPDSIENIRLWFQTNRSRIETLPNGAAILAAGDSLQGRINALGILVNDIYNFRTRVNEFKKTLKEFEAASFSTTFAMGSMMNREFQLLSSIYDSLKQKHAEIGNLKDLAKNLKTAAINAGKAYIKKADEADKKARSDLVKFKNDRNAILNALVEDARRINPAIRRTGNGNNARLEGCTDNTNIFCQTYNAIVKSGVIYKHDIKVIDLVNVSDEKLYKDFEKYMKAAGAVQNVAAGVKPKIDGELMQMGAAAAAARGNVLENPAEFEAWLKGLGVNSELPTVSELVAFSGEAPVVGDVATGPSVDLAGLYSELGIKTAEVRQLAENYSRALSEFENGRQSSDDVAAARAALDKANSELADVRAGIEAGKKHNLARENADVKDKYDTIKKSEEGAAKLYSKIRSMQQEIQNIDAQIATKKTSLAGKTAAEKQRILDEITALGALRTQKVKELRSDIDMYNARKAAHAENVSAYNSRAAYVRFYPLYQIALTFKRGDFEDNMAILVFGAERALARGDVDLAERIHNHAKRLERLKQASLSFTTIIAHFFDGTWAELDKLAGISTIMADAEELSKLDKDPENTELLSIIAGELNAELQDLRTQIQAHIDIVSQPGRDPRLTDPQAAALALASDSKDPLQRARARAIVDILNQPIDRLREWLSILPANLAAAGADGSNMNRASLIYATILSGNNLLQRFFRNPTEKAILGDAFSDLQSDTIEPELESLFEAQIAAIVEKKDAKNEEGKDKNTKAKQTEYTRLLELVQFSKPYFAASGADPTAFFTAVADAVRQIDDAYNFPGSSHGKSVLDNYQKSRNFGNLFGADDTRGQGMLKMFLQLQKDGTPEQKAAIRRYLWNPSEVVKIMRGTFTGDMGAIKLTDFKIAVNAAKNNDEIRAAIELLKDTGYNGLYVQLKSLLLDPSKYNVMLGKPIADLNSEILHIIQSTDGEFNLSQYRLRVKRIKDMDNVLSTPEIDLEKVREFVKDHVIDSPFMILFSRFNSYLGVNHSRQDRIDAFQKALIRRMATGGLLDDALEEEARALESDIQDDMFPNRVRERYVKALFKSRQPGNDGVVPSFDDAWNAFLASVATYDTGSLKSAVEALKTEEEHINFFKDYIENNNMAGIILRNKMAAVAPAVAPAPAAEAQAAAPAPAPAAEAQAAAPAPAPVAEVEAAPAPAAAVNSAGAATAAEELVAAAKAHAREKLNANGGEGKRNYQKVLGILKQDSLGAPNSADYIKLIDTLLGDLSSDEVDIDKFIKDLQAAGLSLSTLDSRLNSFNNANAFHANIYNIIKEVAFGGKETDKDLKALKAAIDRFGGTQAEAKYIAELIEKLYGKGRGYFYGRGFEREDFMAAHLISMAPNDLARLRERIAKNSELKEGEEERPTFQTKYAATLDALEAEIADCKDRMADPKVYLGDYENMRKRINELTIKIKEINTRLEIYESLSQAEEMHEDLVNHFKENGGDPKVLKSHHMNLWLASISEAKDKLSNPDHKFEAKSDADSCNFGEQKISQELCNMFELTQSLEYLFIQSASASYLAIKATGRDDLILEWKQLITNSMSNFGSNWMEQFNRLTTKARISALKNSNDQVEFGKLIENEIELTEAAIDDLKRRMALEESTSESYKNHQAMKNRLEDNMNALKNLNKQNVAQSLKQFIAIAHALSLDREILDKEEDNAPYKAYEIAYEAIHNALDPIFLNLLPTDPASVAPRLHDVNDQAVQEVPAIKYYRQALNDLGARDVPRLMDLSFLGKEGRYDRITKQEFENKLVSFIVSKGGVDSQELRGIIEYYSSRIFGKNNSLTVYPYTGSGGAGCLHDRIAGLLRERWSGQGYVLDDHSKVRASMLHKMRAVGVATGKIMWDMTVQIYEATIKDYVDYAVESLPGKKIAAGLAIAAAAGYGLREWWQGLDRSERYKIAITLFKGAMLIPAVRAATWKTVSAVAGWVAGKAAILAKGGLGLGMMAIGGVNLVFGLTVAGIGVYDIIYGETYEEKFWGGAAVAGGLLYGAAGGTLIYFGYLKAAPVLATPIGLAIAVITAGAAAVYGGWKLYKNFDTVLTWVRNLPVDKKFREITEERQKQMYWALPEKIREPLLRDNPKRGVFQTRWHALAQLAVRRTQAGGGDGDEDLYQIIYDLFSYYIAIMRIMFGKSPNQNSAAEYYMYAHSFAMNLPVLLTKRTPEEVAEAGDMFFASMDSMQLAMIDDEMPAEELE